jgi:hypothetical protein
MLTVVYADCHLCWLSLMLTVTYADCHLYWLSLMLTVTYADCHLCFSVTYADCHLYWLSLCWLSLILTVSYTDCPLCWLSLMLSVAYNKPLILSVFMLNVVILSVMAPYIILFYKIYIKNHCQTKLFYPLTFFSCALYYKTFYGGNYCRGIIS